MKVVIMAGGKGTRISPLYKNIPKSMIELNGKPIIAHQIENFKNFGLKEFIITVGPMGEQIIKYLGNGSKYNVTIEYYVEKQPLGTAGALFSLKDKLTDDFFVLNGDLLFDIDIFSFLQFHLHNDGYATVLSHANNHPYDSSIIQSSQTGLVVRWMHKEMKNNWYKNQVNAGIHILSPNILNACEPNKPLDLDCDVLMPLVNQKKLYAYKTTEYVYDIGTPERFADAVRDLQFGMPNKKRIKNKQQAIFLDRDGVINKEKGIIRDINDFELIEGVSQAIQKMNRCGWLVIVITNQPVIARGELSLEGLEEIHNKMETLLGNEGAFIDDIFVCPHHPHRGYEGELLEYKIACACRKPKPGMLIEASKTYNINLGKSWMIGNHIRDIMAGKAAGCKTAYIGNQNNGLNSFETLLQFSENELSY